MEPQERIKVFLSYASEDISTAQRIEYHLNAHGIDVYQINPQFDLDKNLYLALRECRGVVVLMTKRSMSSKSTVISEWPAFLSRHRSIYPVLLEDCDIPPRLMSFKYIDARHGIESSIPALVIAIVGNAEKIPAPDPVQKDAQPTDRQSTLGNEFENHLQGLAAKASDHNAINDKPVTDVRNDKLGFAPYVFGLNEFINSLDTETPLTIGLNGEWGSGKSSMMRMLETELKKRTAHGRFVARSKWIFTWAAGTLMITVGYFWATLLRLLRFKERAGRVKAGLLFQKSIVNMVTNEYEPQFKKYIDHLVGKSSDDKSPHSSSTAPLSANTADKVEGFEVIKFWARISYLRVKMPPALHYCVWFNAWKYGDEKQLWAALAHTTLNQLQDQRSIPGRFYDIVRQTLWNLKNLNGDPVQLINNHLLPILVSLVPLLVGVIEWGRNRFSTTVTQSIHVPELFKSGYQYILLAITTLWIVLRKYKSPISKAFLDALKNPKHDYEAQLGFFDTFEREFASILGRSITPNIFNHPGKLVIFIDDLDRCSPRQTVKVIEAINLLLDSKGCVFILGMDMDFVSASIENEYGRLAEIMRQRSPEIVSPGGLFLDKIIQVPINLPRTGDNRTGTLVRDLFKKQIPTVPEQIIRDTGLADYNRVGSIGSGSGQVDAGISLNAASRGADNTLPESHKTADTIHEKVNFVRDDIHVAVELGSRLFNENLRKIKRFVNVFRLQIYICDQKQLLSSDPKKGISPTDLSVWVALQMKWSEFPRQLASDSDDTALIELMRDIEMLLDDSKPGGNPWPVWRSGGLETAHRLVDEYKTQTEGQRLGTYLEKWIEDREFLYCIKRLGRFWHGIAPVDLLLDLAQQTELKVHGTATASS